MKNRKINIRVYNFMQLKYWMVKSGCSQVEMAQHIGCSMHTIHTFIRKDRNICLDLAAAIVKFTNGEVSFDDLVSEKSQERLKKIKSWKYGI